MIERLRPVFSIQTLLLLSLIGLAGLAAESFAPSGLDVRLWTIAIAAGLLGAVLGLLRTPDSVAHLTAILTGAGLAVVLVAMQVPQDIPDASYLDRVTTVTTAIRDWYLGVGDYADTETMLISVLLQVITWLLSYLTAWALMRHGWITASLLLPGLVIGASRVTMADYRPHLLEVAVVVGIVLLARTTYLHRKGDRTDSPGRGVGSLLAATAVAILVLSAGMSTPDDFTANTVEPAGRQAIESWTEAQEQASDWIAEHLDISGSRPPDIDDYPRYTAFDEAFSIGGDLDLSDQPEVLVQTAGGAPYLTAQSYDNYTGRGWESTVEENFRADGPDGLRYSPELTFSAGQIVPYSNDVRGERERDEMTVTPLTPSADRIYSAGMFLSGDESASVQMSWRQLENDVFPLRNMDLSTLPPDLTGIVAALLRADTLTVEGDGGLMYPDVLTERERITTVRDQLARRFVDVSWTVGADGRVESLIVTGQLPVYDDNVAVKRAGDSGANDAYTVASLQTTVSAEQLQAAGTAHPSWVTDRYLDLPASVTSRTIDLAVELTAGIDNDYARAKAVEQFLRSHISYDLDVGVPSSDWDIVDYVLFEYQRGYCEHYASAMTVMLRALGIPARTVVGYFPADFDETAGGYLYRQQNAHAWTEAFFPGYGWIRFEPTAARPESTLDRDAEPPVQPAIPTPTPEPPPPTVPPPAEATPAVEPDNDPMPDIVPDDTPSGGDDGSRWPLIAGAVALGLALVGGAAWWLFTRAPTLDPRALFGSLVRWGRVGGVRDEPSVTPREYARNVGYRYPELAGDAYDIVDVYEEQEYGGQAPERTRLERAGLAIRDFQRAVLRRVFRIRK